MAPQRHPRFSEEELRVMVEEIIRVEPQLFGSQMQHTTIARKMELWRRIVDRVNAVGQHPRTRDDIRKRWNDLRGKVHSVVSRHHIAVQRTGGRPPPPPPQLTTWEEQDLAILHPEGLAGVAGGMDSEPLPNVTGQEVPDMSTQPTEEAHSDDSSSVQLDDHPGPSGTSGQSVPLTQSQATTDPPPSGNTSTAPTQRAHTSVSRTHQAAVCPPLQRTQANPPPQEQQGPGGSGSGHTVQGTEAQEQRGTGRAAVRQGEDRSREPTLHKALSNIMGAYHHSQETMATVLAMFQKTQRLQEEQYLGFREELKSINTTLGTIVGVLKELVNTRRDTVAQQGTPDTSLDDELPTTSAGASGQEAPPQDHHTSTPPPADGEPPYKRPLRSRTKTENNAKTPPRNETTLIVTLLSHIVTLSILKPPQLHFLCPFGQCTCETNRLDSAMDIPPPSPLTILQPPPIFST
ncbi:hypothetical protein NDU88_003913 [Pleurodeles waltl]|uniref:Myb/SANT-like DNA-binding domain-containing protein n=1 Tax=Pleurodeles waltl TaxID=8319 RepID=A0AAV7PE71_PLEWA|nr:hypothetical protein NDU88_003913 [Pleurodeles waltl]